MHISNIVIKNFRALEDIHCDFGEHINVIVGPNAVGKTTILQALRLAKALLAPRSTNEAHQTLISLGAVSPHFPQRVFLQALTRDFTKPIEIRSTYSLTQNETNFIINGKSQIIASAVRARMGQSFTDPTALLQFLGSSAGVIATEQTTKDVEQFIDKIKKNSNTLLIGLSTNPATGQISAIDPLAGLFLRYLDEVLPPYLSIFSYFTADRALPFGETPVQLGAADAQQQIESHNSQPQLKYARLKNMIFNRVVMGTEEQKSILKEFERIFNGILRGRRLEKLGLNELGLLSVMTEEIDTKRKVEIDNLSSGEKNLILTCLLIATSISEGGIVLFDEPELHLNPSVCKEILPFMLENYGIPRSIQFIICTHSPEILSGAFSNENCSLYHLKSSTVISHVGRRAIDEVSDALQKLGTSVSESLLYEGTILVEGDDDVAFLEMGFGELLKKHKIKDRGGRKEVEKTAKKLQELEARGEKVSPIFIVLDKDEEITGIKNSEAVRVLQWNRRCMENYLIDIDVITELLKMPDITNSPKSDQGEVSTILRNLALSQLDAIVAKEIYQSFDYKSPLLRAEDLGKQSLQEIASSLFIRLSLAKESLKFQSEEEWETQFYASCTKRRKELELIWEAKWKELCDGKRLFEDFQKLGILRISNPLFKRKIIQQMKSVSSENWRLAESLLKELIKS